MTTIPEPRRTELSLLRSAVVLGLLAVLVPLGLHFLFERQARRLEALGDHGLPVIATVTGVSGDRSVVYEYVVEGQRYEWSVAPEDAPTAIGATFEAHYLPEDPSFNRPGTDRSVATQEAASNRSGTWKGLLGFFWFFGAFAAFSLMELSVLRRVGIDAYTSPAGRAAALRRRLFLLAVAVGPILIAIGLWHASDAETHGESVVPVVLGMLLAIGVIGGTLAYTLREGPSRAAERAARIARWAVPIAIVAAILRVLLLVFG